MKSRLGIGSLTVWCARKVRQDRVRTVPAIAITVVIHSSTGGGAKTSTAVNILKEGSREIYCRRGVVAGGDGRGGLVKRVPGREGDYRIASTFGRCSSGTGVGPAVCALINGFRLAFNSKNVIRGQECNIRRNTLRELATPFHIHRISSPISICCITSCASNCPISIIIISTLIVITTALIVEARARLPFL